MQSQTLCPICLCELEDHNAYKITNCNHYFCFNCCIAHITARSSNFTEIRCPQTNCPGILDDNFKLSTQITSRLSPATLNQIHSFAKYKFFQSNPYLKPCAASNCPGFINTGNNRKQCSVCQQLHCAKCLKLFHTGGCLIDEHDINMKKANYQKCPNCNIWVYKTAGCQYIDCKCGTAFCYNCGMRFEEDPCRKRGQWKVQEEIIKQISKIKYQFPSQKAYYVFLPIKVIVQLVLFILLTVGGSLILILSILLGLTILLAMTPIISICLVCTFKGFGKIIGIVVFPLIAVCLACFFIIALFFYPIGRNLYHHGIYDGLDTYICNATIGYLKALQKILSL